MTSTKRFRIAMVGCGGVSTMHLDGYRQHPDRVDVVAACDLDPQRLRQAQETYDIPRGFSSLQAMIDGAEFDVAVVCTPTPVREEVIDTLAGAGKHLFVEKPMADSLAEAQRMVETCAANGVLLAVDQNFRVHYPFHIIRRLVSEGRIGRIVSILHQDLMFRQDAGWRTRLPRHALAIMGVHWLDGFRWGLRSEALRLTCATYSSPAIDCLGETEAHLQIVFENGAIVTYVESFSTPVGRTETLVLGETGLLVANYDGVSLYDAAHRRDAVETWSNPYSGANKPESAFFGLERLLTAIENGTEPENSGHDNLQTVALLEAGYRSAESGAPVPFQGGRPL